ncbi:hypothetical protein F442_14220 [Phytophthora nicotianae P10297]|uniref:Integrase catalytic domain-containing protein n=1 Tax=Phytophthora nicotianae P10297 TaxID=1317064 RepID=W2YSW9_PHYNI|nr:hypothetical protein F442_14220 [Phytophthora nicotianae P10297]
MHFIFGLPPDAQGYSGVLVFVDRFSKMVHLIPVSDKISTADTAVHFIDTVFRHHFLPVSIVSDRTRRVHRLLDYLAIHVGEKYLDDIYKEDDCDTSDGEDSAFYSDGPRSSMHQTSQAAVKPLNDLNQLGQIEEEHPTPQRPGKEKAWQKKKPVAPNRQADTAGYDTVKLLDILARSGTEDVYCKSSSSSEARESPHTFAGHMGSGIIHRG